MVEISVILLYPSRFMIGLREKIGGSMCLAEYLSYSKD